MDARKEGDSVELFINTLQQVNATFDDGTSSYNTYYNRYRDMFTIAVYRQEGRGIPYIRYEGGSFTYQIMGCEEYDNPICKDIEDLYWTMRYIEED